MSKSGALAKLNAGVSKFAENRYVKVISEGMMGVMAISLVGSVFLIVAQLIGMMPNAPAALKWFAGVLNSGATAAGSLITLFLLISLSAAMARHWKQDLAPAIAVALAGFLILTPVDGLLKSADAARPTPAIDISYLGSKGMFVGILVAVFAVRLYAALVSRRLTLRLPEGVPGFVAKTFEQIVPVAVALTAFVAANALFAATPFKNVHDLIYTYLQMPLQRLGDNIVSACLLVFLSELLWFFGIHGSAVTNSLLAALFSTQAFANMEAVAAGGQATFIVNAWFIDTFKGPRAMALAFLLVFYCKSQHMRGVGKVALGPGFFTITEPMKFGIPMVLNPWLLIPMSLSAVLSEIIAYVATVAGFLPIVHLNISRMIPAPINGFLACGWRGSAVQVLQFVVIVLLYIPFLRRVDRDALKSERGQA